MSQTLRSSGRLALAERARDIGEEANGWDGTGIFMPSQTRLLTKDWDCAVSNSNDSIIYTDMEDAFPDVDPGCKPTGSLVLLQMRQPPLTTAGGQLLLDASKETIQTEKDNCQVGKVIAIGPVAFRNRDSGKEWPEEAWCKVGDFVRVPKYRGDLWTVPYARTKHYEDKFGEAKQETKRDYVRFVLFKDLDITAVYTVSPLEVRAFI